MLASELKAAQRDTDFATACASWKVVNPGATELAGPADGLQARSDARPCGPSRSPTRPRAGARASSGTSSGSRRFDPDERYPAGEFVNQSTGEDGLPRLERQGPPASRTPTSCCGTASACTTCRARRTIRCSPACVCGFTLAARGLLRPEPRDRPAPADQRRELLRPRVRLSRAARPPIASRTRSRPNLGGCSTRGSSKRTTVGRLASVKGPS